MRVKSPSVITYVGFDPVLDLTPLEQGQLMTLKHFADKLQLSPMFQRKNWISEILNCNNLFSHPCLSDLLISRDKNIVIRKKPLTQNYLLELDITKNVPDYLKHFSLGVHYFIDDVFGCSLYFLKKITVDLQKLNTLKKLTERQVNLIIFEILGGLEILHRLEIIHVAICPENIFINGNKITIANFSYAVTQKRSVFSKRFSKFPYHGPDQLPPAKPLTAQTDLWAVGVMFCILQFKSAYSPFPESNGEPSIDEQRELFSPKKVRQLVSTLKCSSGQKKIY
jgi:serine/threonine protein kinase